MGAKQTDASETVMLNRRVHWTGGGIRISPEPRHVKEIMDGLGLEQTVSQSSKRDSDSGAVSLRDATLDATLYRRLVAKLNYVARDRPDIRCAASIMGSHASSPKDADMVKLKRVEGFLFGRPTTLTHYTWEDATRPHHGIHRQQLGSKSRRQVLNERRGACSQWETLEILVMKAVSPSTWNSELSAAVSTG